MIKFNSFTLLMSKELVLILMLQQSIKPVTKKGALLHKQQ